MEKDFDRWNTNKKQINDRVHAPFFYSREIWWSSLGINVGFEQDGSRKSFQRPVLIIRGLSKNTCLVAPLTGSPKHHPFRVPIGMIDGKEAQVIISQLRVIDTRRLINRIGVLSQSIFESIRKSIRATV
jgi:mRNA-degrading endonuclease toxin of MazEF toxin-antitoxin module